MKLNHDVTGTRRVDWERLEAFFHQALDLSLLEKALLHIGSEAKGDLPRGFTEIGEGADFRAFSLKPGGGGMLKDLFLCLKVAKPAFQKRMGQAGMRRWAAGVKDIGSRPVVSHRPPLIPPMQPLRISLGMEELWGAVMPYGSRALSDAAPHWQPVEELVREALLWLKKEGYVLDDIVQGRSWEGVPFLVDFSDLKRL
jgi:hypothetical protein